MMKDSILRLNRIAILSALLLIPGVLVINYFYYKSNEDVFRRGLSDTTMPVIADAIASSMEDINSNYALVSRLFAASFDRTLLEEGVEGERIQEHLRSWSRILDVKNIGIVSLDSGRYSDLQQDLELDYSTPRDAWVPEFLKTKSDYRYSLYDPDDDYAPLYSFFHDFKIRNLEGQVVGVAGLGLSYEKFYNRIKGVHEGIQVSFLDRRGRFRLPLDRRDQSLEELYGLEVEDFTELTGEGDFTAWVRNRESGEDYLLLIRFLPEIQRCLFLELDVTEILKDFRRQSLFSVLAVLLFSLAVVGASILINSVSSRRLSAKAYQDTLTGCYNREYLERHLSRSSASGDGRYSPVLIIFDIDFFKEVNDRRGHKAGDRILKKVAQLVRRQLRTPDLMIRWGGDEFVILLYSDAAGAVGIADRIRESVQKETDVTISVGISPLKSSLDFSVAFDRADEALYEAKARGRNCVVGKGL
jgi:diguanylate cyclase (GGDEF)-like protein